MADHKIHLFPEKHRENESAREGCTGDSPEEISPAENFPEEGTEEDWLWLCSIPGLYYGQRMALLHYFGGPARIREATHQDMELWERCCHDWAGCLSSALKEGDGRLDKVREQMEKTGIRFLSRVHTAFPQRLLQIVDCPYGIFYRGTLPDENVLQTAVVGSRTCTAYGRQMAQEIAEKVAAEGGVVISGLALGVDGYAQRAALDAGGSSVGVEGCGPDICYPKDNMDIYLDLLENGCILSEFPPGTPAYRTHFPMRNRIISGLSDTVIVVEARKRSGSLITADLALDQGREIYAVPGRSRDELSEGCNRLISQGAGIVVNTDTLIRTLRERFPGMLPGPKRKTGRKSTHAKRREGDGSPDERTADNRLTQEEQQVYRQLDTTPKGPETIAAQTGINIRIISAALIKLTLMDKAEVVTKNRYIRKR